MATVNAEKLMDIAVTLADFTHSSELAAQIPAYLCRILELEPITLAVVRHSGEDTTPEIAIVGSSAETATPDSALNLHILDIHRQTLPPATKATPALRFSNGSAGGGRQATFSQVEIADLASHPRAWVFANAIDGDNRLLLILHRRADQPALPAPQIELLTLIAAQLAKLLQATLAWEASPEVLGDTFERLTDREWIVLRSLNSEDGEKQLADRLSLSPHTLHSHIKSIYRKVGVQGRLPLLLRVNAAIRDLRASHLSPAPTETVRHAPSNRSVAFAV